jgi:uncharacterized protein (TIGR02217 family)
MSNEIFPSLPGLKWNQAKTPLFSTLIQVAASGRESRVPLYVYPLYEFDLSYEILRDDTAHNELKFLCGFYLLRGGASDDFLYIDPSDNYVLNGLIGVGDGNNNSFQMVRSYGGFVEPRYDIQASNNQVPIVVKVNGNTQANNSYSISYLRSGLLSFNSNPIGAITANFAYYQRVRFVEFVGGGGSTGGGDQAFSQFMRNLWEAKSVSLASVRQEGNIYMPDPWTLPPNALMLNMLLNNQSSNLYQGQFAGVANTTGWGANQLGYWWLNTNDPHYKWWNGNEILILG